MPWFKNRKRRIFFEFGHFGPILAAPKSRKPQLTTGFLTEIRLVGWGGRDRTCESRDQNPLPYHLDTHHQVIQNGRRKQTYRGRGCKGLNYQVSVYSHRFPNCWSYIIEFWCFKEWKRSATAYTLMDQSVKNMIEQPDTKKQSYYLNFESCCFLTNFE